MVEISIIVASESGEKFACILSKFQVDEVFHQLFEEMSEGDLVSWNTMHCGAFHYLEKGKEKVINNVIIGHVDFGKLTTA